MKQLMRVAQMCAIFVMSVTAFADDSDTFTFPNNTGEDANDLHIVWSRAVTITSNSAFKKTSNSGTNKADFKKGSVADEGSCDVTVSWDGSDPEVKSWYWTNDGKKIRDEKVGDVLAIDTTTTNGMLALSVKSIEGTVLALFPNELVAGSAIRGTVVMQPVGNNNSTLRGTVLQIGNTKLPTNGGTFLATLGMGATALTLLDSNGNTKANIPLPTMPNPPINNPGSMPFDGISRLVQTGKPFAVPGNFDPSLPFAATINGSNANVLAASNWSATVMPNTNTAGKCSVELTNGNTMTNFTACAISIEMSSDRSTLLSGDSAKIALKVGPFNDAPEGALPANIVIENHTPNTLNLGDKNNCVITIRAEDINSEGFFTQTLVGTAIAPGSFLVSGQIAKASCGAKTHVFGIDKLNKGKDAKGWYVEWREDCHEGTCHLRAGHAGDHAYSWKNCKTHDSKDHKDYYTNADDRDAAYRKLEKDAAERKAKNGF